MQINSIIIVGGGSSGWFTASMLATKCPEIDVTLIESPNVPTIGVGESTILNINWFINALGMKDEDWMPQCDATYKATIKFTDFYKKGEYFHYPFGPEDHEGTKFEYEYKGEKEVYDLKANTWFLKKWMYPDTPQTDFAESFWPHIQMVDKNKIHSNEDHAIPQFNLDLHWAYQLDATKLGHYMKTNFCSDTRHILDHVTSVNLDERGWISSLSTKKHGELEADLYIDCTGFNSILLEKTLKVPYISYEDMLINNAAWATKIPYVDPDTEMELATNCTGINNGWVWNVPLFSRIGNGYVYSDKFIDKEIALKEFKEHLNNTKQWCKDNDAEELEYRHIDIKNGIHEKAWHKNCYSIGLSYGFIEPLESTGLVFVIEAIRKLIIVLQSKDRHYNQLDRDGVNREMRSIVENTKHFVLFHFVGSIRDDTEYWRWYTQELENTYILPEHNDKYLNFVPDFLKVLEGYQSISKMRFYNFDYDVLSDGMQSIAVGHHINLYTDFVAESIDTLTPYLRHCLSLGIEKTFEYWKERNKRISLLADNSPTHYEYLKKHIYT